MTNIDNVLRKVFNKALAQIERPTAAQAEAGNYRKGHVRIQGLEIAIENRKGSRRRPSWPPLAAHYGYIKGSVGNDGDHVDVFVGPDLLSSRVLVIDQTDQNGKFDEHKCMIGFGTKQDAIDAYRNSYSRGWTIGKHRWISMKSFKHWIDSGNTRKAFAGQAEMVANEMWSQRLAALKKRRGDSTVERNAAIDQLHQQIIELYAAKPKSPRNSPGQLDLFDGQMKRSNKVQSTFDWDESKHPRDSKGQFASKGESSAPKSPTPGGEIPNSPKDPFDITDKERQRRRDFWKQVGEDQEKNRSETADQAEDSPGKSADKDSTTGSTAPKPDSGESKTPREEAAEESKLDEDYEFARKSAVGNAGEDLKGSARHKRNEWRSLEEAEKDGTAEELVTRDNLLKNEPHDIASAVDKNPESSLALAVAMKSFPAKPGYGKRRSGSDEDRKETRSEYVESYRLFKNAAARIAANESDPAKAIRQFGSVVVSRIDTLRSSGHRKRFNETANGLVTYANNLMTNRKSSISRKVSEAISEMTRDGAPESVVRDAALSVIEGKSLAAATGKKGSGGKKKWSAAEAYVSHAERKGGPKLKAKSANEATSYMVNEVGLRGVQFGNSVSDSEREHHAKMAASAMLDLADVTGLPLEAISLSGELGLAIGARGHGRALAHYEPGSKVINLTRKSGVGSLAHEWGHAFDHMLAGGEMSMSMRGMSADYQSETMGTEHVGKNVNGKWERSKIDHDSTPIGKPMKAIRDAFESSGFDDRLGRTLRESKFLSSKEKTYWASGREKFARCFERYVQRKLESGGRKNSYLAGIETKSYKSGGFWPTDDEIDKMAPAFDALFDAHRTHNLKIAQRVKYSAAERSALVHQLIVEHFRASARAEKAPSGGREITTGSEGDRGYFITIDGRPVFIETKSGSVKRGPKSLRGKNVKSIPGSRSSRIQPEKQGGEIFKPTNRLDKMIVDEVGDDPGNVQHYREILEDAHKMISDEVSESNDDLRNLLANFGYAGKRTGQIISAARRASDGNSIARFDEMTDMARRSYGHLLKHDRGASSGRGDAEQALLNRLKDGFAKPPTRFDERVLSLANEMFRSAGKPADFDDAFDTSFDFGANDVFTPQMQQLLIERFTALTN
ncbi:LPD1 domain-containing protein [Roseiconus lacunae]|uniref:LPD1 domain-containing protein n=1 Tax=Roseiconus lacunae TaxID=2605694 RepID=UPI001E37E78B|nr:LPD1 domain-containing protein [Roseiconus lacunae]MCD0459111.1 hypothetical protein [Roseiconus lacunae]